ncbi:MAG TPA: hypothetical protein VMD57_01705 [Candidatus Baltobacteraceae bacterium]|nr:hypothetical protein [Candidatus Baltobacteraceae bacterium]
MRKLRWTIFGLWLCGLLAARADTYPLADGTSLTGDIVKASDSGLMLHTPDDVYTNVSWTKFSQDGLQQLSANPKIKPFVEPFIEIPESELPHKPEVVLQDVSRLEFPPKQSLFGALFSSSVGLIALLLIYAANIYAGFEVAITRSRPIALVMGVAAVLPILGPIIFLALPVRGESEAPLVEEAVAPAESEPHKFAMPAAPPQEEIHIVAGGFHGEPQPEPKGSQAEIFQRGQFTFNRRFFETRFSGFFGIVRPEADQGKTLVVTTPGALLAVERISRIGVDDVHFEVVQGGERQEIMVPFADIQQIQLKSK